MICLALIEYYHLAEEKGFRPAIVTGVATAIAYIGTLALNFYDIDSHYLPTIILWGSLLLIFLVHFKSPSPFVNVAITAFGIIYLIIPLTCAMRINYFFPPNFQDGRLWLSFVLLVSKATDVGAYFCGKLFGKTKLAPSISPQKTIEGSIGGLALSLVVSVLFSKLITTTFHMTLGQSIWIGILISMLSQFGDLAESVLKRDAGVKDSSRLPGLGGALDVLDSLVFTIPFMYLLLEMKIVG